MGSSRGYWKRSFRPSRVSFCKVLGFVSLGDDPLTAQNSLYVQEDPAGNIAQRMVVKTTAVPHSVWIQARQWHVDERDPTKRQHMEIKVMEAIAGVEGDHKCVRLLHYTTDHSTFSYRLYTGYHPRGDLSNFTAPWNYYMTNDAIIPEPVLWKWLEDLTEASLLLSTGVEPLSAAVDGWKKIVHCDLKPSNVFLDNPDAEIWRSYPQAVVGDFGLSIFTDDRDPFNPSWYNSPGTGTPGWKPPEQVVFVKSSRRIDDTGKLGDASNVWAIGAVVMRLMNREIDPGQPHYNREVKGQMEPQLTDDARENYSKYLCDLVDECVRFRTYHRVELPNLWERIARYTGETNAEYDPDVDGTNEEKVEALKHSIREQKYAEGSDETRLVHGEEKYRIGMAVNDFEEQGDGGQNLSDDNLDDDDQQGEELGAENPYGTLLGGMGLEEILGEEDQSEGHGRRVYPGDPGFGGRDIDEDYDNDEDDYE